MSNERPHAVALDRIALRREVRATLMPGFVGTEVPDWVKEWLAGDLVSVCVYGGNVRDADQLLRVGSDLTAARSDAVIAIDEEGGDVTRLFYQEGAPYPGNAVLGRIDDLEYTAEIGARVGRAVQAFGFTLVLGPDADVNANPKNPVIGTRSFGADPELAARHTAAWVRGLQGTGAIACPKHFPGHGDTAQDSHLALPVVDASPELLSGRDLPPFQAAIQAGTGTIMSSHILLPQLDPAGPATFSRTILQGLLRDELGFTGAIVSDALDMHGASGEHGIPEAAVRALDAGCDLLCIGTDNTPEQLIEIEDRVLDAIAEGRLSQDRVREAAARVRGLAAALAARPGAPGPSGVLPDPEPNAAEIARVAASFGGEQAAREWSLAHPDAAIVRVETTANMAVGVAPWGPFAAANRPLPGQGRAAAAFAARTHVTVDAESPVPWHVGATSAVVIGRDLHRYEFARAGIDALRAAGVAVLTVEAGWPADSDPGSDPDSDVDGGHAGYADLACYGASRLVGSAVISLLEGTHS